MADGSLSDRTAFVTGAGQGIGAAVALALAASGAAVGVEDIAIKHANAVADEIAAAGEAAIAVECDVRSYPSVTNAVALVTRELGRVNLLVANAGIGDFSTMAGGNVARWRDLLEVNVLGVAHSVRATLEGMQERGVGDVVIMASIAGRETWASEPIYISSKHALVGLGGALRKECAPLGVRVSLMEPTIVDTPLARGTERGRSELDAYAFLTPADVARAMVFVVSQPVGVGISEMLIRAIGPEA
jgi:3-oxoacyl-[acyl-carrier protein] reductase